MATIHPLPSIEVYMEKKITLEEQIKEKLYALVDIIIKTCGEKHTSLLLQIENIIKSEVNELVINN